MPQTETDKLVEIIIDSMENSIHIGPVITFGELVNALQDAINARAKDVRKYPSEWTPEESDYWQDQKDRAECIVRRAGKVAQ